MAGCILWVEIDFCTCIRNRQDACSTRELTYCGTGILRIRNRQDACFTRELTYCGTGILPVLKKVLKSANVTTCRIRNRQDACSTRELTYCGTGKMPVLKKVLKSANVTTCRLTAVISIIERMSGIIGNLLWRQMKVK